jgi:hypothetical protein
MTELFDPRARKAIEMLFSDMGGVYDRAGSNFAAGLRGFMNFGGALGARAREQFIAPRQEVLPRQDPRALSNIQPNLSAGISKSAEPIVTGSLNSRMKQLKKRVARRRLEKKRAANPARRLGR